jgi:hypothetical protein
MRAKVCRACGKFLGYENTSLYCNEICEQIHKEYVWKKKNNNGIPSNDLKYITKTILSNYRTWAKERGLEFNITLYDIQRKFLDQGGCCALTGEELYFVPIKTASLDRIDSNVGYCIENIQWVLKDVNKMKNNIPEERFIEICMKIVEHRKNNHE